MNVKITAVATKPLADERHVVQVEVDSGLVGAAIVASSRVAQVKTLARDLLVGEDARAHVFLWERMAAVCDNKVLAEAAAALDIALWDLKARHAGEPLWRTLGGSDVVLPSHVSGRQLDVSAAELSEARITGAEVEVELDPLGAQARLQAGFDALRRHVRAPLLMARCGTPCPLPQALGLIRQLERSFDLAWVAGFVSDDDPEGLRALSEGISAAVAGGAGFYSIAQFLPALRRRGFNVVEINPARLGFTGALQVADAAFGLEIPVVVKALPDGRHRDLATALVYCMSVEW